MNLEHQATAVRSILPDADVRFDQADVLRVLFRQFLGGIRQTPSGTFEWSITDLEMSGEITGIAAPPIIVVETNSEMEAVSSLANELKRIANQA